MSVRDSQGRTGEGKELSFAELCEQARQRAAKQQKEDEKKGKGLEFMAYRIDVARKHFELSVQRKVTPAEGNLLLFLEMGTIGAQNSRSQICSKAEFYIEDLSKALGYKEKAKIWRILKSLHAKNYIIREKTRSKNREVLGLNPSIFSQVLIDKHHEIDKKRHLKLAVDNTKPPVDNSTNESNTERTNGSSDTNESKVPNEQDVHVERTDRSCSASQDIDTTGENPLLDSSRSYLDSLRGQTGNREETNVSQGGTKKRTQEEHLKLLGEQLKQAQAGRL